MIPLRDTIPSRHKPLMTWFLIFINIAIFLFQSILPYRSLGNFIYYFGFVPRKLTYIINLKPYLAFSHYPVITSMFLHGGFFHLLSNMWALWIFGDNVEDRMGHIRFAVFFLISGIIANLSHYLFNTGSPVPAIGASGAIAGVMGAYFIMFPYSRITTLIPFFIIPFMTNIPAVVYLMLWFLSQLYSGAIHSLVDGTMVGGVAWWAHVGGFIGGIVLHRLFIKKYYIYA